MRRVSLPPEQRIADQAEFSKAVGKALAPLIHLDGPVHVVICGAADTGLYAGLLNIASRVGGLPFARSLSVTIIDSCQTPLTLCHRFAEKHALRPQLLRSDILDFSHENGVDIVLLHGVLSFFPPEYRSNYMRHIATWLKADGVAVSSTQMGSRHGSREIDTRVAKATENLRGVMSRNGLDSDEERLELETSLKFGMAARNSHADLFGSAEEAIEFYQGSGLEVESFLQIDNDGRSVNGLERRYRARAIATCRLAAP